MADVCESCQAKAKTEYWLNLPVTKQKFFKIMLGDNYEHELRIPREFMENFREEVSSCSKLRGPSGNLWNVKLKAGLKDVSFSRGWNDFVRHHGIQLYDFLVFGYEGDSTFEVFVFTPTGCEREGSHYVNVKSSTSSCGSALHSNEKANVEDENIFQGSENDFASEETEMSREHDLGASINVDAKRRTDRSRYNALYKGRWKVYNVPECHDKGKTKLVHDDEDEEEDDTDQEPCSYSPQFCKAGRKRAKSSCGQQAQKYHISQRRNVTNQERTRACMLANDHIKKNKKNGLPMIGITMLPTHVYKGLYLTIPKEWAMNNMLEENHDVELRVRGEEDYWSVGCRWISSRQCQLRPRWAEFVLDNNLEEGDVCVFELVRKRDNGESMPVFNVNIFRVVDEVVPLKSVRMVKHLRNRET